MTKKGRNLSKEAIGTWPEIFGEVKLNVLPFRYLHTVLITFKDGKAWEIKIDENTKKNGWEEFETSLLELIKEYDKSIENIDFKLDTTRIKKDVKKRTQSFLKNKNLE